MNTSAPDPAAGTEGSAGEKTPDWLELLLAKYGETIPTFLGSEPENAPWPRRPAAPSAKTALPQTPDRPAGARATQAGEAAPVVAEPTQVMPAMAGAGEEAPDWLAQLSAAQAAEVVPTATVPAVVEPTPEASPAAVPDQETPHWLAQLSAAQAQESTSPAAAVVAQPTGEPMPEASPAPGGPAEETIDWLAQLRAVEAGEVASGPAAPAVALAAAPAPPAEPTQNNAPPTAGPREEAPDWMAELRAPQAGEVAPASAAGAGAAAAESAAEPPAAAGAREGAIDWLAELHAADAGDAAPAAPAAVAAAAAAGLAAEPPPEAPPAAAVGEGEPDWLADLQREASEAGAPPGGEATAPPAGAPEEMPGWLRELGVGDTARAGALASPDTGQLAATLGPLVEQPPQTEAAVPDWLNRLVAVSSPDTTPVPPSMPSVRPAAWLPTTARAADEMETISAADMSPGEVPDWLRELEMAQAMQTDLTPVSGQTPGELVAGGASMPQETPAWLEELRSLRSLPGGDETTAGPPTPAAEDQPPPGWLSELEAMVEHPLQAEPSASTISTAPLSPDRVAPAAPGAEPSVTPSVAPTAPLLEPAKIPEWMARLRPPEADEIPGVEHVTPEEASPPAAPPPVTEEDVIESLRARLGVPQVPDVEGATLFHEITSGPHQAAPVLEKPPERRNTLTTIIWVLIFLAIVLGIAVLSMTVLGRVQNLLGGPAFQRFLDSPAAAGLVTSLEVFREQTTTFPEGAVVIVGMDYTPATEAEMQPLAEMVLRDLLAHGARVVTVSLQPEGAALAQQLLDRLGGEYAYGERTLNLGYLPGEAAGVRTLAFLTELPPFAHPAALPAAACRTLAGCPAWHDVRGLDDVAMVVEVADAAQPVRWWVEQASTTPLGARPMLAAVSAAAAPTVRPYYNGPGIGSPGRLRGMISGVTSAAAYEIYLGRPGRALRSIAAQSVAHLGLVVVALVGTFMGLRSQVATHTP
jgi:hypothetical protein